MAFKNLNQVFASVWAELTNSLRVTVTNPTAAGGDASAANQAAGNASLASIDGKTPALVGGRVPVELDTASLAALETIELGATSLAALESITTVGPLTDVQLRLTPVPVSGTVTITDGSGPVTVDGAVAASVADGADVAQGAKADAAVADHTVAASMIALLKTLLRELRSSYTYETIVKHDVNNFSANSRAIYVGGAGDVAVVRTDNTVVSFVAVPAGTTLDVAAKRVNSTGTTATNMVALL